MDLVEVSKLGRDTNSAMAIAASEIRSGGTVIERHCVLLR